MTAEKLNWIVRPLSEFSDVQGTWDQLNEEVARSPILESRFFGLLLKYQPPAEARVCVLERDGEPVAACILERTRRGVWNTYQPSQSPLGAFVAKSSEIEDLALSDLLRRIGRMELALGLTQLDPYFCERPSDSSCVRVDDYIETACLHTSGDFDQYWSARSKNLRQNIRKQRNRLKKQGIHTNLEIVENAQDIGDTVDAFGELESAGWKSELGTALHPSNRQGRFYRELLKSYAADGRARVYRYLLDGELVACDLCILGNQVLVILKTTYSEEYSRFSPAMLMREEQIRILFDDVNVNSIEFYGKALDWHKRLTDLLRTLFHVTVYRCSLVARVSSARR